MANIQSLPLLLKQLRLSIMARHWETLSQEAVDKQWPPELYLAHLCELEAAHRYTNRLKRLLSESKLPLGKHIKDYAFNEVEGMTLGQFNHLTEQLDWVKQGHNILLFGASGLGKTHLACSIGRGLIEQGVRVKFTSSIALVQQLQKEKQTLGLIDALTRLDKYDLLILDDIGYIKRNDSESQVLFELIAHRYEKGSLLITSNQAFSEWDAIFGDNMITVAAIDRLVHHSKIYHLNGESYRKKQAIKNREENRPT